MLLKTNSWLNLSDTPSCRKVLRDRLGLQLNSQNSFVTRKKVNKGFGTLSSFHFAVDAGICKHFGIMF